MSFDVVVEKRPWKTLTFHYKEKNRVDSVFSGSIQVQVDDGSKKVNWVRFGRHELSNYDIHVLLKILEELAKEGYKL